MGKDLAEAADSYVDPAVLDDLSMGRLAMMARVTKDMESEQLDYDALLDGSNPNPSPRDQEYMQHSSLWGHQYVSGGAGEGPNRPKPQVKTDASLPAYCNPPNPCPFGYTEDQGCTMDFENTAAFSREYQAAQDCMCDAEHMFNCPAGPSESNPPMDSDLESFIARQFHTQEHKNLVAKKFHVKKVVCQHINDIDGAVGPNETEFFFVFRAQIRSCSARSYPLLPKKGLTSMFKQASILSWRNDDRPTANATYDRTELIHV